jgi:hypothetical protein
MRPVVVRAEYGRLGNQIFQYAAMRAQAPLRLFLLGFDALFSTFSNVRATHVAASSRFSEGLIRRLESNRFPLPKIVEDQQTGRAVAANRPFLYSPKETHFQSDLYKKFALELTFSRSVASAGDQALSHLGVHNQEFLVAHVRGTDYHTFPDPKGPAVLPVSWIARNIADLREEVGVDQLVIVGDDKKLMAQLRDLSGGVISLGNQQEDLYILSQASGGVLSASSFSWWGAAFAHSQNKNSRFIAPRLWLGHRLGRWAPLSIQQSSHLRFVPVGNAEGRTPS